MVYTSIWAGTHPDVSLKSIVFLFLGFHLNKMVSVCVYSSNVCERLRVAYVTTFEWQPIKFEDTLKDSQIEFRTISKPSLRVSRPYLGREESFYLSLFLGVWYICILSFVRLRIKRILDIHARAKLRLLFITFDSQREEAGFQFQFFPVTQHSWKEEALLRERTTKNEKEELKE